MKKSYFDFDYFMPKYSRWFIIPLLAAVVILIFTIQFSQQYIIGADGFLHGRLALKIIETGFLQSLPQAHFSWFVQKFSDKDFIYHLYLTPFVLIFGYITGTKLGAFVMTSLLFITVILVCSKYLKRLYLILPILILFSSSQFIRDTSEARPFILAIILTLMGINSAIKADIKRLSIISFIYGLTHLSAWILPFYALVLAVYQWIKDGKFNYKIVITPLCAYLISFLFHPNFPNNLFYFYLNGILVPFYAFKTGVLELGAEFFPLNTTDILNRDPMLPFVIILMFISTFIFSPKLSSNSVSWGLAFLMFLALGMISMRNITQMYPIMVIFSASYLKDLTVSFSSFQNHFKKRIKPVLILVLIFIFSFGFYKTLIFSPQMFWVENLYARHFTQVSGFINSHISAGERIFHTNWSDSQYLIGLAPNYEYFVTLDPIYMYSYNRDLYNLYRQVSFGDNPDPYLALKNVFKVNYGYAGKNFFGRFISQIRTDSRFRIVYEDDLGLIFQLI